MRVALYNQMFALNGKSVFSHIIGHWAVHFQADKAKIQKRANLDRTIGIIKKSNADVIGIAEVLESQEKELKEKLGKLGYKYVFFGKGHKTKHSKLHVEVAIASKIECRQVKTFDFPVQDEIGGGGGVINCYFPGLGLSLINTHLATPSKKVYPKQMRLLRDYLESISGKVILMGDFNLPYGRIKDYFKSLRLATEEIRTCFTTPLFKWFSYKDLDHILMKGLKKKNAGELNGYSDHKMIYVDFPHEILQ